MKVERQEEYRITDKTEQAIQHLFAHCFPGYPDGRTYYKQLPDFRLLAWEAQSLAAHLAVEHRMISVEGTPYRIFGVVDLCVHPDYQHQRLASKLLSTLEQLAKDSQVDFILLIAAEQGIYENNGFFAADNLCRWLMLVNHRTVGIARRKLHDCLMVKCISGKPWPDGEVDFLGAVF